MLVTRLISGIVLIAASIVTIFCGSYVLAIVLGLLAILGYLELARAMDVHTVSDGAEQKNPLKINKELFHLNGIEIVGVAGIAAYYAVLAIFEQDSRLLFYLLFVMMLDFFAHMFLLVFAYPKYHANRIMESFFAFVYAGMGLSFIYLTRAEQYGIYIVWLIYLSSWGCDTFAYCAGVLLGKHKMAPVLSPKKSVEGAVGGLIGAAVLGVLYSYFVRMKLDGLDANLTIIFAIICVAGGLISMVGDLAASAVKRNFNLKDYGTLIPGHGGVMDRFDSIIFTAPIIYFLSQIFLF